MTLQTKKATLSEPAFRQVARSIEQRILSGSISPGEALPSETALAAQLGVNRSTIREAIRALEQNGLVRREDGKKKLFATIPQSGEISRRLQINLVLDQVTFEELWEAMHVLEPATAHAAARRRQVSDLEALENNLEATRRALRDSISLTELDIEFHALIAEIARNRAIKLARMPIGELFYPPFYRVISRLNAGERLLFAHEKIANAIRDGDAPVAREWMDKHLQDFRRGYELANLDLAMPVEMNRAPF